jgi:hypothetical protein
LKKIFQNVKNISYCYLLERKDFMSIYWSAGPTA